MRNIIIMRVGRSEEYVDGEGEEGELEREATMYILRCCQHVAAVPSIQFVTLSITEIECRIVCQHISL